MEIKAKSLRSFTATLILQHDEWLCQCGISDEEGHPILTSILTTVQIKLKRQ